MTRDVCNVLVLALFIINFICLVHLHPLNRAGVLFWNLVVFVQVGGAATGMVGLLNVMMG